MFKQIAFFEIIFTVSPYTSLYRVQKRRMVMDITKLASILALGPKKIGIIELIAEDLLDNIMFFLQIVDKTVASKMLCKMIFFGKCIDFRILITM